MEVHETNPISMAKAKEILVEREKEGEMGHEQKITVDYLRRFNKLEVAEVEEFIKKLSEALPTLKDHQIISLVNAMPQDEDEIKVIFMKERMTLEKDQISKILEILPKMEKKK